MRTIDAKRKAALEMEAFLGERDALDIFIQEFDATLDSETKQAMTSENPLPTLPRKFAQPAPIVVVVQESTICRPSLLSLLH